MDTDRRSHSFQRLTGPAKEALLRVLGKHKSRLSTPDCSARNTPAAVRNFATNKLHGLVQESVTPLDSLLDQEASLAHDISMLHPLERKLSSGAGIVRILMARRKLEEDLVALSDRMMHKVAECAEAINILAERGLDYIEEVKKAKGADSEEYFVLVELFAGKIVSHPDF